jgi:two-component system, cell cycle sensor histidine kinase and response regulator CckA
MRREGSCRWNSGVRIPGLIASKMHSLKNRLPRVSFFFLLLLCLFSLSGFAEKVITVGVYENPPLLFINEEGEVSGIAVDVLQEIARREGFQMDYLPGTLADCLERLDSGEIDLQPALDFTPQRAQKFDFTQETLLSNWGVVYAHRRADIESILDLDLKHIAVLSHDNFYQGSGGLSELTDQFKLDCEFIEVNDYATVIKCIEVGIADAGLVSRLYQVPVSQQSEISRTSIVCNPVDVGFAFPKESHQAFRWLMDRHLSEMKRDTSSVYHQSVQKWLGESRPWLLPQWLSITLMVAAGVLLLFVVLTIFLRIQVRRKTTEIDAKNRELQADIAERKRVEQALRESDEVYRKAIETATGVPYRLRFGEVYGTGQYEFLGDGIYDLLGIAPDELDFELFGRLVREVIFREPTGLKRK